MKVVILSDTHGDVAAMRKILHDNADAGLILHAGDYAYDLFRAKPAMESYAVIGNCDRYGSSAPDFELINLGKSIIYLTHGHIQGVKYGLETLASEAKAMGANVAVFGHTHRQLVENHAGILMLNPGSANKARSWYGPAGYLTLEVGGDGDIMAIHPIII